MNNCELLGPMDENGYQHTTISTSSKLREQYDQWKDHNDSLWDGPLLLEAADEIDRYRSALEKIYSDGKQVAGCGEAYRMVINHQRIANKALLKC